MDGSVQKTWDQIVGMSWGCFAGDFNPYHDASNGQFTFAEAVGAFAPLRGRTENGERLLQGFKEKHGEKQPEKPDYMKTVETLSRLKKDIKAQKALVTKAKREYLSASGAVEYYDWDAHKGREAEAEAEYKGLLEEQDRAYSKLQKAKAKLETSQAEYDAVVAKNKKPDDDDVPLF
jgi:hypothetical protein